MLVRLCARIEKTKNMVFGQFIAGVVYKSAEWSRYNDFGLYKYNLYYVNEDDDDTRMNEVERCNTSENRKNRTNRIKNIIYKAVGCGYIQLQHGRYITREHNTDTHTPTHTHTYPHTHTDFGRLWLRVGCTALGPICRCKMPFIFHRVREIPDRRGVYTYRCGGPRIPPPPPTTTISPGMTGRLQNLHPQALPRAKVRCTSTRPYTRICIYRTPRSRSIIIV